MKLFYCPKCGDILRVIAQPRRCVCGLSGAYYTDRINAVYRGESVPLGIANDSFRASLRLDKEQYPQRPSANTPADFQNERLGVRFEAFIIPHDAKSISREP